ncbi:hypothetical protein CYK67_13670 [Clostridium perfringens]|nr:hypothetical protein CYK68_13475 [Clostridium perfringens]PWX10822.1 hypothetical protein CYK67_13670 [Clostridium perfringens]PWX14840.1 hypothetical protein CYK66_13900 [Clostridium perfringens]
MSRGYGSYSYDNLNSGEITMDRKSIKGIIFLIYFIFSTIGLQMIIYENILRKNISSYILLFLIFVLGLFIIDWVIKNFLK